MQTIAFVNGTFGPIEEAKVSVEDRGYQFGDGIYEVMFALGHQPFAVAEHLARWERSYRALRLTCPYGADEIEAIVREALSRVEGDSHLVYLQLTRGVAPRLHAFPGPDVPPSFVLTVRPNPTSSRTDAAGVDAALIEDIRWSRCDIKAITLLPAVLATQEAKEAGCAEAVLHRGDIVTECANANVFIVKDGRIITHPLTNAVLAGITRGHLLEIAREMGIPVDERPFTVAELLDADEALSSSTGRRTRPLNHVDGHTIGAGTPGPVTNALRDAYRTRIAQYCGVPEDLV